MLCWKSHVVWTCREESVAFGRDVQAEAPSKAWRQHVEEDLGALKIETVKAVDIVGSVSPSNLESDHGGLMVNRMMKVM